MITTNVDDPYDGFPLAPTDDQEEEEEEER